MQMQMTLTGVSTAMVREIAAFLSRNRDQITGEWQPRVCCEGPELWGMILPRLGVQVATNLTVEMRAIFNEEALRILD